MSDGTAPSPPMKTRHRVTSGKRAAFQKGGGLTRIKLVDKIQPASEEIVRCALTSAIVHRVSNGTEILSTVADREWTSMGHVNARRFVCGIFPTNPCCAFPELDPQLTERSTPAPHKQHSQQGKPRTKTNTFSKCYPFLKLLFPFKTELV